MSSCRQQAHDDEDQQPDSDSTEDAITSPGTLLLDEVAFPGTCGVLVFYDQLLKQCMPW